MWHNGPWVEKQTPLVASETNARESQKLSHVPSAHLVTPEVCLQFDENPIRLWFVIRPRTFARLESDVVI